MSERTAPRVSGLQLLSEVLLIGVLVCVACLPVVTILAAGGAGAVLLRELVEDERTPTVRRFVTLMGNALRDPLCVLAPLAVLVVGTLDALAVFGGLPGAVLLGPLLGLVLALTVLLGLRAAARWQPGQRWRAAFTGTLPVMARDPAGTVMLVAALVIVGFIVSRAPAFAVVLPGFVVMAAVAVERRLSMR